METYSQFYLRLGHNSKRTNNVFSKIANTTITNIK